MIAVCTFHEFTKRASELTAIHNGIKMRMAAATSRRHNEAFCRYSFQVLMHSIVFLHDRHVLSMFESLFVESKLQYCDTNTMPTGLLRKLWVPS